MRWRWAGQVQRAGSKVEGGEEPVQGDARGQEQRAGGTPGDRNKAGFFEKKRLIRDVEEEEDVDSDNDKRTTWTKAGQVEMDKMTEMIGELRENCNVLQQDLLSARQDDTRCNLADDRLFPNEVGSW